MSFFKKSVIFPVLFLFIFSCKEGAELTVINELPNTTLRYINYDGFSVSSRLLPGQTATIKFGEYEDFPREDAIHFEMTAANRSIGLRTIEEYILDEGENIEVVVDSTLKVTPN